MISETKDIDLTNLYVNTKKEEKMNERILNLHKEIKDYLDNQNYQLKSDLTDITSKSQDINYICSCGKEKTKKFKEITRKGCRDCNNKILKEIPTNYSVCPNDNKDEIWKAVVGGFVSNKGRACNSHGKVLIADERGRFYLAGKLQYAHILMATGFKIENSDKLEGQKSNLVVRNKNKEELILENIYIGTRNEVGSENGKKSRQSIEFKENMCKSLYQHIQKFKSKLITELPYFIFFEDGSIYNDKDTQKGGKRFLSFAKTSILKGNQYYKLNTVEEDFYVHRLICYAFKPIDGLSKIEDYKDYEVNHIDGNTLNNHIDNLEWVTHSSNMSHAYDEKLNKKVRSILQYELKLDGSQGDLIKEYESIAQASRETDIKEHRIREIAKGRTKPKVDKDFIWRYKNEEESEQWSKKYSSKS